MEFKIFQNKNVSAHEFGALIHAVGWGEGYTEELICRSIRAYPFIAHARSNDEDLLGYISAFSDGAFSTMLGELVVHPKAQRFGIGRALLSAVENAYPGVPVYVKPLGEAKKFFLACGYHPPAVELSVLFKHNGANQPFEPTSGPAGAVSSAAQRSAQLGVDSSPWDS